MKHFGCHAFLVHGDADAWPEEFDAEGDAAKTLPTPSRPPRGAQERRSPVQAWNLRGGQGEAEPLRDGREGATGDEAGDVIMFPQMRRHRLGADAVSDPAVVADFVRRAVVSGDDAGELSRTARTSSCART